MPGAMMLKLPTPSPSAAPGPTTSNRPSLLQINTGAGSKRPHSSTTADSPVTASPISQAFKRPRAIGPSLTTPTMQTMRKTSLQQPTPTSAHPLRQSSTPGDLQAAAMSPRSVSFNQPSKTSGAGGRQYSPSVASTTTTKKTGATTTTNGASKKRKSRAASSVKSGPNSTTASQAHGVSKRYGTSKAKKAASVTASTRTARRSTTAVSVSSRHVPGAESAAIDPSIASDSDLSADDTPDASTQTREQESQQAALRFLIQKFTPEQNDRYDAFNRYSFSKPLVKRLANAVVSQSLGANIVTALRSMAKTFLGELVEGSVAVQREWLAARAGIVGDATTSTDKSGLSTPLLKGKQRPPVYGPDGVQVLVDETRPPLLPEHVREALRRYKGRTKALKRGAQLAGSVSSGMACGTSGGRIGRVRLR